MVSDGVEVGVDFTRDRRDLSMELCFYFEEGLFISFCNEVDSESKMSEAACAADAMQVGIGFIRHVEIDDDVDCVNIDATGEEIRAHETALLSIAEVMEYSYL